MDLARRVAEVEEAAGHDGDDVVLVVDAVGAAAGVDVVRERGITDLSSEVRGPPGGSGGATYAWHAVADMPDGGARGEVEAKVHRVDQRERGTCGTSVSMEGSRVSGSAYRASGQRW